MKNEKEELLELLNLTIDYGDSGTRLFLITRHVKEGVKKNEKMLNKHVFKLWQINIDPDVRTELFNSVKKQLEYLLIKKDLEIHSYEVIDDDIEKIYSYSISNRSLAFNDIAENQIKRGTNIPKVNNFLELIESIWAYCIKVQYSADNYFLAFKKFGKSKVAIEESSNANFWARFSTTDNKLTIYNGESINIDKRLDCIFAKEKYYIFHKSNFETVMQLDDEFLGTSENFVSHLKEDGIVEGLKYLENRIHYDKRLLKKISKIVSYNGYRNINEERLSKMQEIANEFNVLFKVKNDKIILENDEDVDIMLKMLEDYYLISKQTGNKYGASAKKKFNS